MGRLFRISVLLAALLGLLWCIGSPAGAYTASVRRQPLQIRPLLGAVDGSCHVLGVNQVPLSHRSVTLPAPNEVHTPCWRLGPTLLSLTHVERMPEICMNQLVVMFGLALESNDIARVTSLFKHTGTEPLVVVGLGQALEQVAPNPVIQLRVRDTGFLQLSAGMLASDPRRVELASALGTKLQRPMPGLDATSCHL